MNICIDVLGGMDNYINVAVYQRNIESGEMENIEGLYPFIKLTLPEGAHIVWDKKD